MAKPSFLVHGLPEPRGGTDYQLTVTYYTSAGTAETTTCGVTLEADTAAALNKYLKDQSKLRDDAEKAEKAKPKVPHKMLSLVGVRIDATQPGNVSLALADTPVDTDTPPAAEG